MSEPELWSAAQVADHFGWASAATARRTLSRWGVGAAAYNRGDSGRPEARYDAEQVREAAKYRPGQGTRTDLRQEAVVRPKLPAWTEIGDRADGVYEAVDSRGVAWRLWCVWGDVAGRPPLEWRFAPVDALDQFNVIEHIGGGKELDIASMRIDVDEVIRDQQFWNHMGFGGLTD